MIVRALLVALTLLLSASAALAQGGPPRDSNDERARVLYENGAILYEEGRYEDAIIAWQEAHRLSERPLFLFNIANALERIGRWEEALEYLNRYRAFAPSEERTVLERRMRNIERRLADTRAREAEDARRSQEDRDATRRDEADAKAAEEVREEGRAEGRAEERDAAAARDAADADAEATRRSQGTLVPGIVLLGGGLGGVAAGGALAGAAVAARAEATALCKPSGASLLCPDTAEDALRRDADLSLASDIALGVGAGAAAVGLVLILVHLVGDPPPAVAVLPTAGPTGLGFGLQGTFP